MGIMWLIIAVVVLSALSAFWESKKRSKDYKGPDESSSAGRYTYTYPKKE